MISKAIRDSAEGEACTIRIPGVCCFNPETTVFCHVRRPGTGIGLKPSDLQGFYGCRTCHDYVDQRTGRKPSPELGWWILDAVFETQKKIERKGLIKCGKP